MSVQANDRNRGELQVGLAAGGELRWAATDLTGVVEEGRRRLDLSPLATVALGRCGTAAALLLQLSSKNAVRVTLEARGDGPMRRVFAEADASGGLRGLVGEPQVGPVEHNLAIAPSLGKGLLRVTQEVREQRSYTSEVELVSGEIGADVAHYLAQSEQRRSAVLLGVLAKPSGVGAAGGMIVEALPGADDSLVDRLEGRVAEIDSISRLLDREGLAAVVEQLLGGLEREVLAVRDVAYRCRCSRQGLLMRLGGLSSQDVAELGDDRGLITAECAFCGAVYRYASHEIGGGELPQAPN